MGQSIIKIVIFESLLFCQILFCGALALAEYQVADPFQPLMEQARKEQKTSNLKVALKLYRKVYFRSPGLKKEAFSKIIETLNVMKRWSESIEALNQEIKSNPFNTEYRVWLAEVYMLTEKYPEALATIAVAEKMITESEILLKMKTSALQKLDRHQELIALLTRYLESNPKQPNVLAARAESYIKVGQTKEAYVDLKEAYQMRPFDEKIMTAYIHSALLVDKGLIVRTIGKKCIEQFFNNISCYESLGQSALNNKDYISAIRYFEAALGIDAAQSLNRLRLAEALALSGRTAESDRIFQDLMKAESSSTERTTEMTSGVDSEQVMRSWVQFLRARKDRSLLGIQLKIYSASHPKSIWAAVELSKLLLLVGNQSEAMTVLKKSVDATKSDVAKMYYGHFLFFQNQEKEAGRIIANIQGEKPEKHFYMGLIRFQQKNFAEANSYWQKVDMKSPFYFKSRVNLALTLEKSGEVGKSRKILEQLIEQAPGQLAVSSSYLEQVSSKLKQMTFEKERAPAAANVEISGEKATEKSAEQKANLGYFLDWELPQL